MNPELAGALARLDGALGSLETAVARHLDVDTRRSDIETELAVMQDDRMRLAGELDSATVRIGRLEAANDGVGARLDAAIAALQDVLAEPGQDRPGPAGDDAGGDARFSREA